MTHSITFTKEEFAILLQMTFLGDTILHSTLDSDTDLNSEVIAFKQKIYTAAKDFELGNWIDKNKPGKLSLMEGKAEEFLEDVYNYDEAMFWETLIDKLVERDMIKEYSLGTIKKMGEAELLEKEETFRQYYYEAFNRTGVRKLFLKK